MQRVCEREFLEEIAARNVPVGYKAKKSSPWEWKTQLEMLNEANGPNFILAMIELGQLLPMSFRGPFQPDLVYGYRCVARQQTVLYTYEDH